LVLEEDFDVLDEDDVTDKFVGEGDLCIILFASRSLGEEGITEDGI